MVRSIESIQTDIAKLTREIQELRRNQLQVSKADSSLNGKRIYELARALDTLYAEKRSLHAPALAPAQVSERRRASRKHGKAADDLMACLFGQSRGGRLQRSDDGVP